MQLWQVKGRNTIEVDPDTIDHNKRTLFVFPGQIMAEGELQDYEDTLSKNIKGEEREQVLGFLQSGLSNKLRLYNFTLNNLIKSADVPIENKPQIIMVSYDNISEIRNTHIPAYIESKGTYASPDAKDFAKKVLSHKDADWNKMTFFGDSYGTTFGAQTFHALKQQGIPHTKRDEKLTFITAAHVGFPSTGLKFVSGIYVTSPDDLTALIESHPHTGILGRIPENHSTISLVPTSGNELLVYTNVPETTAAQRGGTRIQDSNHHILGLYLSLDDERTADAGARVEVFKRAMGNALIRENSLSPEDLLKPLTGESQGIEALNNEQKKLIESRGQSR